MATVKAKPKRRQEVTTEREGRYTGDGYKVKSVQTLNDPDNAHSKRKSVSPERARIAVGDKRVALSKKSTRSRGGK